jgi:hypothetical protein
MSWIDTYDATFFLAGGSIVLSALTLSIKYCLKSKCEHFTLFWGLVKIDRRVDLETQIDLKEIEEGGDKPTDTIEEDPH